MFGLLLDDQEMNDDCFSPEIEYELFPFLSLFITESILHFSSIPFWISTEINSIDLSCTLQECAWIFAPFKKEKKIFLYTEYLISFV